MKNKKQIRQYIQTKRSDYERLRFEWKKAKRSQPTKVVAQAPQKSEVLSLWGNCQRKKIKKDHLTIHIPSTFSILENTQETLKLIQNFITKIKSFTKINYLYFDYSKMSKFDLAAETILDSLVKEIQIYHPETNFIGNYPCTQSACRFISSMGIIKELELPESDLPDRIKEKLNIFRRGNYKSKENNSGVGRTLLDNFTQQFSEYLNKCLQKINYKLKPSASRRISQYISEILYNIKEHSNMEFWRICGYLDIETSNPTCEIAIVNFGTPIAATFTDEVISNDNEMKKYISTHSGIFSRDVLITVYSLQGNVSSKNTSTTLTRGQGTIEYLSFFIELSNDLQKISSNLPNPKMIILSGNTLISLNGAINKLKDEFGRWIIPFNTQNSLNFAPDKRIVSTLKDLSFPGTLITLKFNLPNNNIVEKDI